MSIRSRLLKALQPFPQWSAIGERESEQRFRVELRLKHQSLDVTGNNNCAALVPLTLVMALPDLAPELLGSAVLHIHDIVLDRQLGTLKLRHVASPLPSNAGLAFFEVEGGRHACLSPPRLALDRWLRRRTERKTRDAHNFVMASRAVEQIMTFYICPRQVVLVSVSEEGGTNIFPMDILGPLAGGCFSLGLRNTSPSVETIKRTRRVALSNIRAADKGVAYKLGAHHKAASIDLDALPFKLTHSTAFGLPAPAMALRAREVEIDAFEVIGSHTFFVGRPVSDERFHDEPHLCHTAGFHAFFQARHGKPLAVF